MSQAYVLLSGGIDSSTCLGHALEKYGSVTAVSVVYGQRHKKEVEHAHMVANAMNAKFIVKDIGDFISVGGLTNPDLVIPSVTYEELGEGVSPTYVPFRNGTLLSLIAGMAAADPEAEAIYYGAHAEDAENDAYPDCSVPFMAAMRDAIRIGTYEKVMLEAPLISLNKWEVVRMGEGFQVPWALTWSCYEGDQEHCGICPTCRARHEAFELAGVMDPTSYASEFTTGGAPV